MKKKVFVIFLLLAALVLAGCGATDSETPPLDAEQAAQPSPEPAPEPTPSPEEAALKAYADAVEKYMAANDYRIIIESDITRSIGEESYCESIREKVHYKDMQSDEPIIYRENRLELENEVEIEVKYIYSSGKVYTDCGYNTEMEKEAFLSTLYPIELIDAENYGEIAYDEESGKLSFSEALSAEKWLPVGEGELISAEGTVCLKYGEIHFEYKGEYVLRGVTVSFDISTCVADADPIVNISDELHDIEDSSWMKVDDIRAYEYWNRALCSFLYSSSQTCSGVKKMAIYGEDLYYTETSSQNAYGFDADSSLVIEIPGEHEIVSHGYTSNLDSKIIYYDGTYTETQTNLSPYVDEIPPEDINPGANIDACIPGFYFIEKMEIEEDENNYLINFSCCNNGMFDFGYYLQKKMCARLYNNSDFLESKWSDYSTVLSKGCMKLDKVTLLPTEFTFEYNGHYEVNEKTWLISIENEVKMDMLSATAYDTLLQAGYPVKKNAADE